MKTEGMTFNIYVYKDPEDNIFVAHCLELDLVATADTINEVQDGIIELIKVHVTYAFETDNLANMYSPAPGEVWKQYEECDSEIETRMIEFEHKKKSRKKEVFIPFAFHTSICNDALCSAQA